MTKLPERGPRREPAEASERIDDLLRGCYVDVVLARDAPPGLANAVLGEVSGEPLMGQWTPGASAEQGGTKALAPDDGILVEAGTHTAVGVIGTGDAALQQNAAFLSLYLAQRSGGAVFFLEGALRYCLWRLTHEQESLHAEVLASNERMLKLMTGLGIAPEARLRRARYVGGDWQDLVLFTITLPGLLPTAHKWAPRIGLSQLPSCSGPPPA